MPTPSALLSSEIGKKLQKQMRVELRATHRRLGLRSAFRDSCAASHPRSQPGPRLRFDARIDLSCAQRSFLSHPLAQHKVLARGGLPRLALDPVLNTDVIVGKLLIIAFEFVYCGHDSGILRDRRCLKCIPMRDSYRSVVEGGPGIGTNVHSTTADELPASRATSQGRSRRALASS